MVPTSTPALSPLVRTSAQGLDALTQAEWVLTNGLGGFAMGTASGVPTRRYHGWLVAATRPPVGRVLALAWAAERLVLEPVRPGGSPQVLDLSSFAFHGEHGPVVSPRGVDLLERFERGEAVAWHYAFGPVKVVRELTLVRGTNEAIVRYRVNAAGHKGVLHLRPMVALRDFHGPLLRDNGEAELFASATPRGVVVDRDGQTLTLAISRGAFAVDAQWWRNFDYAWERARGLDDREDLWSPGEFHCPVVPSMGEQFVELAATVGVVGGGTASEPRFDAVVRAHAERLEPSAKAVTAGIKPTDDKGRHLAAWLARAADQFVVKRFSSLLVEGEVPTERSDACSSIIAGYPWFSDWGRDTCIALPGLLLTTGRHAEAFDVLRTFARLMRDGLVPNCFEDATGEAQYNTVDASLWFVHAACEYRRLSGDTKGFEGSLLAACLEIVDSYRRGTAFDIRMDEADGLIAAGDPNVQLTWMDAKRDGVVFTPRHGKAVEINALWINALTGLADATDAAEPRLARAMRQLGERASASMRTEFWNPAGGLFDVLEPTGGGWKPRGEIRPNQIFAVSLPHSALTDEQSRAVVRQVRDRLLTPVGLRTLDPADPGYLGRFRGPLFERDRAYHNGTVWPWLLGAYAEAVIRVGRFSTAAKNEARQAVEPLARWLLEGPAVGQLPEVFDGDSTEREPRKPDGCPAQAWSVAEVIRVLALLGGK